jgi:hypothetical protein
MTSDDVARIERSLAEINSRLARLEAPGWFSWLRRGREGGELIAWLAHSVAMKTDLAALEQRLTDKLDSILAHINARFDKLA